MVYKKRSLQTFPNPHYNQNTQIEELHNMFLLFDITVKDPLTQ